MGCPRRRPWTKLRTPVCSYPIIVTHLSFNFLCLLLLYSIYLNASEKLQDAYWGWGRYDNTPLNSYPFTAASRVFTTFRILEISYISNVFLFRIPFENILFRSGFKFQFLLFLYSFNTQYSPRFQRHLLLVKF
jgi:hypothetical protein